MMMGKTLLLLAMALILSCAHAAEQPFSTNWTPKPLVAPTASATGPTILSSQAVPAIQPDAETWLKPAEPFIAGVEKQLSIQVRLGTTLVQRLNHLQAVLFGVLKYQDAGQLLSKLGELFPQEAAQAQAELSRQLQTAQPTATTKTSKGGKQNQPLNQAPPTLYPSPRAMTSAQSPQPAPPPKRKRFWEQDDDWDSSFNDSFFSERTDFSTSSGNSGSGAGSALRSLGSGLAGLSLLAGSLAGSYFLNKKLDGVGLGNGLNHGYGYGYDNYGYAPYGAYGNPYYGYPGPYTMPYGYIAPNGNMRNGIIPGRTLSPGLFSGMTPGTSTTRFFPGGYTTTQTYPLY